MIKNKQRTKVFWRLRKSLEALNEKYKNNFSFWIFNFVDKNYDGLDMFMEMPRCFKVIGDYNVLEHNLKPQPQL